MKITFKKIDFNGTGRRINEPEIRIELKEKEPGKPVLSISGGVWNAHKTDFITCGQCLDTMLPYLKHDKLFLKIYRLWSLHHLNDMNAGTPKQMAALEGKGLSYEEACRFLESKKLLVDGGYEYGTAWLYREIPAADLAEIKEILGVR